MLRLRRDIPNNQASDRFSLDVQFVAEKEKKKKKMNATDSHNTQSDAMQILALVSAIGLALNILNLAVFYLTPVHKVKPAYASAYLGTLYSTRVVLLLLFCQYFKWFHRDIYFTSIVIWMFLLVGQLNLCFNKKIVSIINVVILFFSMLIFFFQIKICIKQV